MQATKSANFEPTKSMINATGATVFRILQAFIPYIFILLQVRVSVCEFESVSEQLLFPKVFEIEVNIV